MDNLQNHQLTSEVKRLLGEEAYQKAFAPITEASGLPNAAYWSQEWLALEQERLFRRSWVFVATDGELAEAGSIKPVEVGGTPLMLVHGQDQQVRAFHNVCRHRGTQLVDKPCKKAHISCPYHAWSYRLNGSLRLRPHFNGPNQIERFAEGDKPELSLYPVRCSHWNGCYFVDISGEAEPLEYWLQPMLEMTGVYDFSHIRWIGKRTYNIQSNWKLVLENYMEGYHVFAAHPRLIKHAPMEVRWSGKWQQHVFYNDYVAPKITEGRGDSLPHYPGLSGEDKRRGLWFACFPNFAVEVFADQFVVLASYPVAPDQTREEMHFFVVGDEAATDERFADARAALISMWDDLNLEDVELLERLQQGRRSIAFEGSYMSPAWEQPAHELARKVIEQMVR